MYADLSAIAEIARLAGRCDVARDFAERAAELRARANRELWDDRRGFYLHRWLRDEYADGDGFGAPSIEAGSFTWDCNARARRFGHQPDADGRGKGRELVGLVPWYRGMAPDDATHAAAWDAILDPLCFAAPYGPTTAERTDPWFSIQFDCRANGNSFPLVTARILNGLANLLNDYTHRGSMTPEIYRRLFATYVRTQMRGGTPYVAEFHHPDEDLWVVDRPIGQHYFHSSFIDLLITGMLGLRPRADDVLEIAPLAGTEWSYFAVEGIDYRGRRIDMAYDETAQVLGWKGFAVFVDGVLRWSSETPQATTIAL